MQGPMECDGKIEFGPLPWEVSERLAAYRCTWLEFVPGENALIVRRQLPAGCPAVTGVPCEVITLMDVMPADLRAKVPGGSIRIRDCDGRLMRLVVEAGEVRIQWPGADYSKAAGIPLEELLGVEGSGTLRVSGWARFAGSRSRSSEIEAFVGRFGGIFPEGDLPSEGRQAIANVRLRDVDMNPRELVDLLRAFADPAESLAAELDFRSAVRDAAEHRFRIVARDGRIEALRPALWDRIPE